MSSCSVCLCPCENDVIVCPLKACQSVVCGDCFEMLMFCLSEKKMVACPASTCEQHYPLPHVFKEVYAKVVSVYLHSIHNSEIEESKSYRILVEDLKNKRRAFIQKKFPLAIQATIDIAYSDKLNKISRNNEKIKKAALLSKRCMNFVCKGKLYEEGNAWKCMLCKKRFCKECELEKKLGHVCNEADVASVSAVKNMVKCPKCGFPAVKSQGCNNMTCAICRTNFDYITGKPSEHGNHTRDDAIKLKQRNSMLALYENVTPDIQQLLSRIDAKHPKHPSITPTITAIKKEMGIDTVAKKYSTYVMKICAIANYMNHIAGIEKKANNGGLDIEFLNNVIKGL